MFILASVPTSKRRKVILKIEENAEENVHVKMFRYGTDVQPFRKSTGDEEMCARTKNYILFVVSYIASLVFAPFTID